MPGEPPRARTIEELVAFLHEQLDDPIVRQSLAVAGFKRRIDLVLYIDRGVVGVKAPSVHIT